MKQILLTALLMMIGVMTVMAQQRVVTGTVTSEEDPNGLPGATISVKGTTVGTVADLDGSYSIPIPEGANELVFSFVGYASVTETIGNRNVINVSLASDAQALSEVMVIAPYGTALEKGNFTGSASAISKEQLERRPLTNIGASIEGQAAGVITTSGSGQPGSTPEVRIRGIGSVNSSNTPLYVVDGVPYDAAISNLNPDDIEDITILKDASSAALYGSRAANGVIMVTTKKGRTGRPRVNFKVLTGTSSRALPEYDRINSRQYYPLAWESLRNGRITSGDDLATANLFATENVNSLLGYNPFDVPDDQIVGLDGMINPNANLIYTDLDWFEPLIRNGSRNEYNLSYSGANDNTDYFASMGYLNEQGFIIKSGIERFNGRLNINTQATDWLKVGTNLAATIASGQNARSTGSNSFVNPFRSARVMGPMYPVYAQNPQTGGYILDDAGERIYDTGDLVQFGLPTRGSGATPGRHVIQETLLNEDLFERELISSRIFAEITFLKNFKFTTNVASDRESLLNIEYDNTIVGDGAPAGRSNRENIKTTSLTFNQLLTYTNTIDRHFIEVLAGHENYDLKVNRQRLAKQDQVLQGNIEPDNFVTINSATGRVDRHRIESYFSRINYVLDDKYTLSASYRRDGSSKFFRDVRWGNFWSFGGAWRLDQEDFFNVGFIDQLKLRSSYGQVGNDALLTSTNATDYYPWQALYDLGNNNANEAGILQASLTSADLLWEANSTFDIGLDFALGRRFYGTIEYFNRESANLLFRVPLSLTTGLEDRNQNIGTMFNRGIEFQIAGDLVATPDFSWNVNVNVSTFKNEFKELPFEEQIVGTKKYMVGQSINDFWLREWIGTDAETGEGLYRADEYREDNEFDRIVGSDTLTTDQNNGRFHYAGTSLPDFFGGITNTFTYKNFSLSALFSFSVGGLIYDGIYAGLMSADPEGGALHVDILDRWQSSGDPSGIPRMNSVTGFRTNAGSDRWLINASYMNLRSVNLSYTLPVTLLSKVGVQDGFVFLTGENLGWLSARKGMFVSQNFSGTTTNTFTPARTITLGLNLNL